LEDIKPSNELLSLQQPSMLQNPDFSVKVTQPAESPPPTPEKNIESQRSNVSAPQPPAPTIPVKNTVIPKLGITERSLWYRVKKLKIQVRMTGESRDPV
jgi:hypothetical protein